MNYLRDLSNCVLIFNTKYMVFWHPWFFLKLSNSLTYSLFMFGYLA